MGLEMYLDLNSQPCRSVFLFAKKNKIPFEFKHVSLFTGQQHSEEYAKINPKRQVPAIKDDDFTLSESVAILKYLARKYQTPDHWYPNDLQKRARVDEYLAWQHSTVRPHGSKVFMFKLLLPALTGEPIPEVKVQAALEDLRGSLKTFEEIYLQDKPYIAGDALTIADLVAIVELMQPALSGFDPFEGSVRLAAWRDRVKNEIGVELFNEAHAPLLQVKEMAISMPKNPATEAIKQNLLKRYN
uniref:glutathione transferase n=1 Tax=Callorhinchus milii TaxID=7868 RepID=V9KDN2_CALMI